MASVSSGARLRFSKHPGALQWLAGPPLALRRKKKLTLNKMLLNELRLFKIRRLLRRVRAINNTDNLNLVYCK